MSNPNRASRERGELSLLWLYSFWEDWFGIVKYLWTQRRRRTSGSGSRLSHTQNHCLSVHLYVQYIVFVKMSRAPKLSRLEVDSYRFLIREQHVWLGTAASYLQNSESESSPASHTLCNIKKVLRNWRIIPYTFIRIIYPFVYVRVRHMRIRWELYCHMITFRLYNVSV